MKFYNAVRVLSDGSEDFKLFKRSYDAERWASGRTNSWRIYPDKLKECYVSRFDTDSIGEDDMPRTYVTPWTGK